MNLAASSRRPFIRGLPPSLPSRFPRGPAARSGAGQIDCVATCVSPIAYLVDRA